MSSGNSTMVPSRDPITVQLGMGAITIARSKHSDDVYLQYDCERGCCSSLSVVSAVQRKALAAALGDAI